MSYEQEDDTIEIIYKESSDKRHSIYNNKDNLSNSLISNTNDFHSEITLTKRSDTSNAFSNNSSDKNISYSNSDHGKNSLLNDLKASIRSNFKSIKREKEKHSYNASSVNTPNQNLSQINSEKTTIESKAKSEKEKLLDYYKNLKSSSRLTTSNNISDCYITSDNNNIKNMKGIPDRNDNKHYRNSITVDNSVNIINEYVIYNSFKNMFGNKRNSNSCSSNSNRQNKYNHGTSQTECYPNQPNNNQSINQLDNKLEAYNMHENRDMVDNYHNDDVLYTDTHKESHTHMSTINKLETSVLKDFNNLHQFECSPGKSFDNIIPQENSFKDDLREEQLILNKNSTNTDILNKSGHSHIKNSKCRRCLFYKNKMNYYKKSFLQYRKKYLKQKKTAEMLNLKLFFEINKNSQNSEKLCSTHASSVNKANEEREKNLNNMLYDKLQGNLILFEKLENEMVNKDILIKQQENTIKTQNETINTILKQFDVFMNQGNFLLNDILILKQSLFDKNIKDVVKDFDVMTQLINDYTSKIQEFSENNKNNITMNKTEKLYQVMEIDSECKENDNPCEELSLSFSKTEIDLNKKSYNYDRSMRLLDLNYSQYNNDFMISCQSISNSENNYEINKYNEDHGESI